MIEAGVDITKWTANQKRSFREIHGVDVDQMDTDGTYSDSNK